MQSVLGLRIATSVAIVGLIAVPVLIGLAYRGWIREIRPKLPQWRNGIGLAALVLSSLVWLWYAQWWVLTLTGHAPSDSTYQIDASILAAICAMLSVVLAIGLKGMPRWEAIGAAVLLVVGCRPVGYV
jgi:hypothetical protein